MKATAKTCPPTELSGLGLNSISFHLHSTTALHALRNHIPVITILKLHRALENLCWLIIFLRVDLLQRLVPKNC